MGLPLFLYLDGVITRLHKRISYRVELIRFNNFGTSSGMTGDWELTFDRR